MRESELDRILIFLESYPNRGDFNFPNSTTPRADFRAAAFFDVLINHLYDIRKSNKKVWRRVNHR